MAVLGSLELVRKRIPTDEKLALLVDNAILGAKRGAVLTKRMLAFARQQELKEETIHLPKLCRRNDRTAATFDRDPSLDTRPVSHCALRPIRSDANQVELALLNLAVNARDAMPGGGEIILTARDTEVSSDQPEIKAGRYVCLSVIDNGEGMDQATLSRATEPFFTTKEPGKCTGLGLPMVYGLAQQSGGCFVLKSQPGKGTTAELWLPVDESANSEIERQVRTQETDKHQPLLVILVVDDDSLVLTNTVAMLEGPWSYRHWRIFWKDGS